MGVAIAFFVRRRDKRSFKVNYLAVEDYVKEDDKRDFVAQRNLATDQFVSITPNQKGDWLNQREESEWDQFLALADKKTKAAKTRRGEGAIFKFFTLGVVTARDDWVYAETDAELDDRLRWFIAQYEHERESLPKSDRKMRREAIIAPEDGATDCIKFTRALKDDLAANVSYEYDEARNRASLYRPFDLRRLHYWSRLNEMPYQTRRGFPDGSPHLAILISGRPAAKPFTSFATEWVHSYDTLEKTECLPRFDYSKSGERVDNITDWALNKFVAEYGKKGVTKDAIFAYCYAVLHDLLYREKYALNLKREFPRIPFYPDFAQWAAWGEALMAMHIGYEDVEPWPVTRVDTPDSRRAAGTHPKPVLKSHPDKGLVVVDADTQITGIPRDAWDYRLGNRSAIDWVLDQHKEKTPRDPTSARSSTPIASPITRRA